MAITTAGRTEGIWLDVTSPSGRHEIAQLSTERMAYDALLASDFYDDVAMAGQQIFQILGYEDADTTYATLYQVAPSGRLDWSNCFAISGSEAE